MQLPQIQPQHDNHFHESTKRRVKAACTNCKKAKARCDQQRPCSRCVQKNCAECVDAFPRRVGRRRNHYLNTIVTENEVKQSGALIKSKPRRRKRRRSGMTKKSDDTIENKKGNDAKERQTPPLRAKKFKLSKKLTPLNLDIANQDLAVHPANLDIAVHPIMERNSNPPTEFLGIDFSVFDPITSPPKYPNSAGGLLPTVLSTPKNFPFGEPDSNFDGISNPEFKSIEHRVKEPSPSYPLKENSNDDLLFDERAFLEPVSQNFTEIHSDTASDSELSTDHLIPVQDVGELNNILPVDDLSWMESLPRDESTIFGMDSILC
eukprot:CAMPEP_0185253014 /NCGR_PEP_ID=MMETSP1359-20130426/1929_1 /TAXON_ID=552665 /ORGANISM="Bigelowiella longifila, Strain CCMP242" /LENGTH=319 /DNA_ID=CAMNT_0027835315 /DNA_START=62 /DNA_END=1021 /DNA_ORIENTATION=+